MSDVKSIKVDNVDYEIKDAVAREALSITRKTLTAGQTSVSFTSDRITDDSIFEFYASVYGIAPTEVSFEGKTVTTTWDAQDEDIEVGMAIR